VNKLIVLDVEDEGLDKETKLKATANIQQKQTQNS
jgi:hypothetical protein